MGDRAAKNVLFDQFARVGKALSSGKRLELLDLLAQGERTVDALARASELGLSTASAHLQTLKAANLVSTRREGTKVFYRLAGTDVAQLLALVRAVANAHLPDVEAAARAYLGPGTEQVTRDELLDRIKTGQVTVIDVRPREEYEAGHIPAAVSVPLDELADHLAELPAGSRHRRLLPRHLLRAGPRGGAAAHRARPHRDATDRRHARMAPRRPARRDLVLLVL